MLGRVMSGVKNGHIGTDGVGQNIHPTICREVSGHRVTQHRIEDGERRNGTVPTSYPLSGVRRIGGGVGDDKCKACF